MIQPEPMSLPEKSKKGGHAKAEKGKKAASSETELADQQEPSKARLSVARTVHRLAKKYDAMKIVEAVMAGNLGLE